MNNRPVHLHRAVPVALIAFKTLLYKEIWRFLRIWTQTLLPSAITMSLYFFIFGQFLGSQLHAVAGYTYIQYIVPGLVMMAIITNSYSNTAASFFLAKFNKSIEELLVSPMSSLMILLGYAGGGVLRGVFVGVIVTIIALLFTRIPVYHPGMITLMAIMSAVLFSLGGLINGILAKRFDDISFVPTFILTPLTYLGGVFYSIDELPHQWRIFSLFNPVLGIVNFFRYGFLGVSDIPIVFGLSLVCVLLVIVFLTAWGLLYKGVSIKV